MRLDQLEDALRQAAESQPPVPDRRPEVVAAVRRRHWAAAAAAVVAATVVVASVVIAARQPGDRSSVRLTAEPEVALTDGTPRWRTGPPSPLSPRSGAIAVWAGDRFLVVGGSVQVADGEEGYSADAASFDPATDEWAVLAPSPVPVSADSAAVWTGEQLIVWSGSAAGNVGAAFTPATNTWRDIPPSPLEGRWNTFSGWSGSEVLIWGGATVVPEAPDPVIVGGGAAFNPSTQTWRNLAAAPRPRGAGGISVWAGDTWVIGGGENGTDGGLDYGFMSYNPATDTWTRLPNPPFDAYNTRASATLESLFIWSDDLAAGASWQPTGNAWQREPAPPSTLRQETHPATAVQDGQIVLINGSTTTWAFASYDPEHKTWTTLPKPPIGPRLFAAVASSGRDILIFGGFDGRGQRNDGALLSTASEAAASDYDAGSLCAPPPAGPPRVGKYAVGYVPTGFSAEGDGYLIHADGVYGSEATSTEFHLRFLDEVGRWIDISDYTNENPQRFLATAHGGADSILVTLTRCTAAGGPPIEQQASVSASPEQRVLGLSEWEYGGFVIRADPTVPVEELHRVAEGMRFHDDPPAVSP